MRTKNRGMTLVELLIVVAIIGVLSTVGVPTFRRMIQKAKQAEAKSSLGGLYKAEKVFFGEHNTYGNNLAGIRFEMEGSVGINHQGNYTIGFPITLLGPGPPTMTSCGNASITWLPDSGQGFATLSRELPTYYTGTFAWVYWGRPNGYAGGGGKCLTGSVASDGSSFRATASGVIIPKLAPTSSTNAQTDTWQMDDSGTLTHVNDGVQ